MINLHQNSADANFHLPNMYLFPDPYDLVPFIVLLLKKLSCRVETIIVFQFEYRYSHPFTIFIFKSNNQPQQRER